MDNPFLKAMFVQPRVVLGRELLPLSAYHAAALMLLDSPFVSDGDIGKDDIILAAYVCSMDSEQGPKKLFPELDLPEVLAWGAGHGDFDLVEELEVFSVYMDDYLDFPELWQPTGEKTKTSGIPWPVYCVTAVLQNMRGISEYDAWNMPLGKLVAYKMAIAEQNGAEVVSETQRNRLRWLELTEAAMKADKEKADANT